MRDGEEFLWWRLEKTFQKNTGKKCTGNHKRWISVLTFAGFDHDGEADLLRPGNPLLHVTNTASPVPPNKLHSLENQWEGNCIACLCLTNILCLNVGREETSGRHGADLQNNNRKGYGKTWFTSVKNQEGPPAVQQILLTWGHKHPGRRSEGNFSHKEW